MVGGIIRRVTGLQVKRWAAAGVRTTLACSDYSKPVLREPCRSGRKRLSEWRREMQPTWGWRLLASTRGKLDPVSRRLGITGDLFIMASIWLGPQWSSPFWFVRFITCCLRLKEESTCFGACTLNKKPKTVFSLFSVGFDKLFTLTVYFFHSNGHFNDLNVFMLKKKIVKSNKWETIYVIINIIYFFTDNC